jgi:hypothetical protein
MEQQKAKKPTKTQRFDITVTKAEVKAYAGYGFGNIPAYKSSYNPTTSWHLCLTGVTTEGFKVWVKLPEGIGIHGRNQLVAVGDQVRLEAIIKGTSDDLSIAFLTRGRLVAVIDAAEEAVAA